jgi:hypothetical protein
MRTAKQFIEAFDTIGNRTQTQAGGDHTPYRRGEYFRDQLKAHLKGQHYSRVRQPVSRM